MQRRQTSLPLHGYDKAHRTNLRASNIGNLLSGGNRIGVAVTADDIGQLFPALMIVLCC